MTVQLAGLCSLTLESFSDHAGPMLMQLTALTGLEELMVLSWSGGRRSYRSTAERMRFKVGVMGLLSNEWCSCYAIVLHCVLCCTAAI